MVRDRFAGRDGTERRSGVVFRDEGTGAAIGTIYYVDKNVTLRTGGARNINTGPAHVKKKHMSTTSAKAFAGADATSRPFTTGDTLRMSTRGFGTTRAITAAQGTMRIPQSAAEEVKSQGAGSQRRQMTMRPKMMLTDEDDEDEEDEAKVRDEQGVEVDDKTLTGDLTMTAFMGATAMPVNEFEEETLTLRDEEDPRLSHRNVFFHQFESAEMDQLLRNSYHEYKKLPVAERTKTEGSLNYASVFPDWVTHHTIFSSVDGVIRDREAREALTAEPSNRTAKQLERVAYWLREVWAHGREHPQEDIEALAHCVHLEKAKGGELLASEGTVGYALYIVVEGVVEGRKGENPEPVLKLGKGQSFGDAVLVTGKEVWSHTMSVVAPPVNKDNPNATKDALGNSVGQALLLKVRKSAVDAYHKDRRASDTHQALRCLRTNPMFRGWPRSKLEKMCHLVRRKVYKPGEVIVKQDDRTDDVYFVIEGRCEAFKEVTLTTRNRWPKTAGEWEEKVRTMLLPFKIMDLKPGDYFGERAILRDTGRAATVVACDKTVCMALGKNEFLNMLQRGASVIESVYAHNNAYPTDEELLTLFTALRIQHRHEGLIRDSVTKNRAQFRPGEDDIHIRKTDLKSRDVLSLPKRYGKLPDRTRERLRRDSLVISTTSAKPEQTGRIVTIAKRLVCPSAEMGKPLSRNDLKQMMREGKRLPLSYASDILKQAAAMSRPPSTQQLDEEKKRMKAALLSPSSDTAMVHHSPIGRYLKIQDTLPALITVQYRTHKPQLVASGDQDMFTTAELTQMSTTVFKKVAGGDRGDDER